MKRAIGSSSELDRRGFIVGSAGLLLLPALSGCGGSGGLGNGTTRGFKGTVTLPNGVSPTSVTVVSGLGQSPVTGGAFSVEGLTKFPALVSVLDNASSRVMLLGMLDPSLSSQTLDATNCAATLIFVALGGSQLTPDGRAPLLAAIKANAATATLATTIASRLNADNFALLDGDSAIKSALSTAVAAFPPIRAARPSSFRTGGYRGGNTVFTVHGTVVEGSYQAPFVVTGSSEPVVATNGTLRETHFSLFFVGSSNLSGIRTDLASAEALLSDHEIPRSTAVDAEGHLQFGQYAFSVSPHSASGTANADFYGLVRISPLFDSTDPAFFTDSRYAGNVAVWRLALEDMYARAQVQVPAQFLIEAMGQGCIPDTGSLQKAVTSFGQIGSAEAGLIATARTGTGLIPSTKTFLLNASSGDAAAQAYINAIQASFGLQLPGNAAIRIANLRGTILIFAATGALDSSLLLGELIWDLTSQTDSLGNPKSIGYLNEASYTYSGLIITPVNATYQAGGPNIGVSIPASWNDTPFTIHWVLNGANATMTDGSQTGTDFTSTATAITVLITPSTAGTVTVRCDIILKSTGQVVESATSTLSPIVAPPNGSMTLNAPQQTGIQSNTGPWTLYGSPGQKVIVVPNSLNNYRFELGFGDNVYGSYPGSTGVPPYNAPYSTGNFAVHIATNLSGPGFTQGQVITLAPAGITIGEVDNAAAAQLTITSVSGKTVGFSINCTLNNNFDLTFASDATFALTATGTFDIP